MKAEDHPHSTSALSLRRPWDSRARGTRRSPHCGSQESSGDSETATCADQQATPTHLNPTPDFFFLNVYARPAWGSLRIVFRSWMAPNDELERVRERIPREPRRSRSTGSDLRSRGPAAGVRLAAKGLGRRQGGSSSLSPPQRGRGLGLGPRLLQPLRRCGTLPEHGRSPPRGVRSRS